LEDQKTKLIKENKEIDISEMKIDNTQTILKQLEEVMFIKLNLSDKKFRNIKRK